MKLHKGYSSGGSAGDGFEGIQALMFIVGFLYLALGQIFLLPYVGGTWFLILLVIVEAAACVLWKVADYRSRRETTKLKNILHRINE